MSYGGYFEKNLNTFSLYFFLNIKPILSVKMVDILKKNLNTFSSYFFSEYQTYCILSVKAINIWTMLISTPYSIQNQWRTKDKGLIRKIQKTILLQGLQWAPLNCELRRRLLNHCDLLYFIIFVDGRT